MIKFKSFAKTCLVVSSLAFLFGCGETTPIAEEAIKVENKVLDASCGTCNFDLRGDGCAMAVKVGDKAYFVDGIPDMDKAQMHEDGGICVTVRQAKVSGEVMKGRFVASALELLPIQK